MAAFSVRNSFYYKRKPASINRPNPRSSITCCCQSHEQLRFSDPKKKKEGGKLSKIFSGVFGGVEKLGKGLKESLSPKSKGDWKDVMLMSISFAVYVYISQLLVTAYCSWMAMLNQ
ncbi:hypothetical protein ACHQM5_019033 [Ranunculus cassubicifolius]